VIKKLYNLTRAIIAFPFFAVGMVLGTIALVIVIAGRKVMP
jgi:hypothetical protein